MTTVTVDVWSDVDAWIVPTHSLQRHFDGAGASLPQLSASHPIASAHARHLETITGMIATLPSIQALARNNFVAGRLGCVIN
jgi:hypothetical protein